MMGAALPGHFREVWIGDFEFYSDPGEVPVPVCAVFREMKTGRTYRLWQDELLAMTHAPFSTGTDVLFVAYYASAEMGCFLKLGWPLPRWILDLFTEFRALNNGLVVPSGNGLLGAMVAYRLDSITADEKTEMRDLVLSKGPWSTAQRHAILDYCERDVRALEELFPEMLPQIIKTDRHPGKAMSRSLHRGRYMKAVARMEFAGIPIDTVTLRRISEKWEPLKTELIAEVDTGYHVYENGRFVTAKFEDFLRRSSIPWPRLECGRLALDDNTFRDMARAYPQISALRELRHSLTDLRLNALSVGSDGRNRCLISPYRARTGRNQPSNSKFIFGPSVWIRGLIQPPPGRGIAYVDFRSQEIGIAAALSGDELLMEGYRSGDPYLSFAIMAGLAPIGATKQTHKAVRERCKALVLGLQYGMSEVGLAARLGIPVNEAKYLIGLNKRTYPTFWRWSDRVLDTAMMGGKLETVFGWPLHPGFDPNPRSLRNFPMQANGAEMLRLACCYATEAGIAVCAPVHDALLIEAPLAELDDRVAELKFFMTKASCVVLNGFEIPTSEVIVRYPDRYMDEERGRKTWNTVMRLLDRIT